MIYFSCYIFHRLLKYRSWYEQCDTFRDVFKWSFWIDVSTSTLHWFKCKILQILFSNEIRYRGVNFLSFYVPLEKVQFSALFGILEKNRSRLNIADYTISQGSLVKALENILHTRSLREPYKKKKQKGDKRLRYVHSKVALH